MNKRLLILLGLVLSLLLVLAACGPDRDDDSESDDENDTEETEQDTEGDEEDSEEASSDGDSNEITAEKPETLTLWADEDKAVGIEDILDRFTEEHGIEIEVTELEMATVQREQIRLDGPAGTGPDVLTLPHDQIGQLANEGIISSLDLDEETISLYTDSAVEAVTYEGELYGVPKATETPIFMFNRDLMDEAPETFDELWEMSQEMQEEDQYGFLALFDNYYFAHSILAGHGGYVFEEQDGTMDPTALGLNNEGAIEGGEYIQQWYTEGLFPEGIIGEQGGSTMTGLFEDGEVASAMDGPWAVQGLRDAGIDFGAAPMPTLPNGEYPQTFVGVKSWNVSSYSEHQEWATELVRYLGNEENSLERYEIVGEIPPVASLIDDPAISEDEVSEAVAIQSERGVPMPNIPEMGQVWEPMATALQLIVRDEMTPEDALNEAVDTIQTNIESNQE
ncbi:extracellular solute-binding protein [Halalkalibacillus halophilus]|uniref:extracellular solute-binding protein n=1 Tax=Halalkalibacillus halophilus TaxID=392827 RepID=UPI0003FB7F7C|nr:extracellular solute-binding protein [Halalkalibacillus halophilus]